MLKTFDEVYEIRGYSWKVTYTEEEAIVEWPPDYPLPAEESSFIVYLKPPRRQTKRTLTDCFITRWKRDASERTHKRRQARAYIERRAMKALNVMRLEKKNRGSKAKAPNRRQIRKGRGW